VVASERPVIQTTFNVQYESVKEIKPGHALIIKKDGQVSEQRVIEPLEKKIPVPSNEFISPGTDVEIYRNGKNWAKALTPAILDAMTMTWKTQSSHTSPYSHL